APTYGMYEVCADINDVEYRPVLLNEQFQTTADHLLAACDKNTKVIWFCSPNNPTGNLISPDTIDGVLSRFDGIVVVDEAYGDFAKAVPFRNQLNKFDNILVLNTMSKAWGSAAIRLGMAFASEEIIELMNRVKYPYNVNLLTQRQALEVMNDLGKVNDWLRLILNEREKMLPAFAELPLCRKIYPTDANFFLAKVSDANRIYKYLIDCGIVVRNRNNVQLCENCLRVTIGSPQENNELLKALRQYK
ncbi:MAG: aminotransferase class I/II-fold pyridoxal phosphate-dependent enzyme, partial [Bacteroidaceae bacterium]|nr:aminotransferase class I/II-fold pyridoxal phosphate-dependent enzyme [Bacteroidaceae bacterium]